MKHKKAAFFTITPTNLSFSPLILPVTLAKQTKTAKDKRPILRYFQKESSPQKTLHPCDQPGNLPLYLLRTFMATPKHSICQWTKIRSQSQTCPITCARSRVARQLTNPAFQMLLYKHKLLPVKDF